MQICAGTLAKLKKNILQEMCCYRLVELCFSAEVETFKNCYKIKTWANLLTSIQIIDIKDIVVAFL